MLCRYNHYDVNTQTLAEGEAELDAHTIADPIPTDYTDISTITNWHTYGEGLNKDYKYIRDEIKLLVVDASTSGTKTEYDGFNQLTGSEKLICCHHKIGTQAQRNSIVGESNAILLGLQYDSKMADVRKIRLGYAKTEIHSRLPTEAGDMLDTSRDSIIDYFMFGREGTAQGDNEGITDYLNSVVGTGYETTGMSIQSWTPTGMTLSALITKIEDIILNGNY